VPFTARDEANRAVLSIGRVGLESEQTRLESDLALSWSEGGITDVEALDQVKDQLASLEAVDKVLARDGAPQLVLLDLAHDQVQAAVARGDVDTADNVAVFVPRDEHQRHRQPGRV
jgi:hypothetical protein